MSICCPRPAGQRGEHPGGCQLRDFGRVRQHHLHASGPGAVNLYDATTGAGLGIGGGVLLTSGTTPGTSNTLTWYGADTSGSSGFYNGDADIDAVVNTVFQTQSYDATTLKSDFTVTDPALTSVGFDLVFGSEEYPEWVDAFVDCAVVIVLWCLWMG